MKNVNPGARFGIAFAIAGEVRLIPFNINDWNMVTLNQKQQFRQPKQN